MTTPPSNLTAMMDVCAVSTARTRTTAGGTRHQESCGDTARLGCRSSGAPEAQWNRLLPASYPNRPEHTEMTHSEVDLAVLEAHEVDRVDALHVGGTSWLGTEGCGGS
jgi:hypothetical protein